LQYAEWARLNVKSTRPHIKPYVLVETHTEAEDVVLLGLVKLGELVADLILGDVSTAGVDDIDDLKGWG
jgi:hypothetical protein